MRARKAERLKEAEEAARKLNEAEETVARWPVIKVEEIEID